MQNIWQVSREYAGFAEAGGVKNVTKALAGGLAKHGYSVTQFLPLYGCTPEKYTKTANPLVGVRVSVYSNHNVHTVNFLQTQNNGVRIIFIVTPSFTEKNDVYVYTAVDERQNSQHRKGTGHSDANELNVILQKAVLEYALFTRTVPDILQCQDAHTALIPVYAKTSDRFKALFLHTGFVVTIHNAGAGYHQHFTSVLQANEYTDLPEEVLEKGIHNGNVEPFLLASHFAVMTTVSPWYAQELTDTANSSSDGLSSEFAKKGNSIRGITNGIEFEQYDPTNTELSLLPVAFDPPSGNLAGKYECRSVFLREFSENSETAVQKGLIQTGCIKSSTKSVFFVYQGRIARQKGLDVLCEAAKIVLDTVPESRFIITGQGENEIERRLENLARVYSGRCIFLNGYDRAVSRLCIASADFLVLPSIFEPCGLEDFIGQLFATIPVAHAVGGLNKIIDEETGFLYQPNTPEMLASVLIRLTKQKTTDPDLFLAMARFASLFVRETYDWMQVIKTHYIPLYNEVFTAAAQNSTE